MIEDKGMDKFFKDAFDGYDTPFDADKMFQEIEGQIPTKKKSKRRFGFWFMGCAEVIGLAAISIILYSQFQSDSSSINTNNNQPSQLHSSTDITSLKKLPAIGEEKSKIAATKTTKNTKPSNTDISNKENTSSITKGISQTHQNLTPNKGLLFNTTNHNTILDSKIFYNDASSKILSVEGKSAIIRNTEDRSTVSEGKINALRTIGSTDFAQLISPRVQYLPKLDLANSFEISTFKTSTDNIKKWEIGITSSYLWTNKNSSYSGSTNSKWFGTYKQSEKLHHTFNSNLYLKYNVSNNWFLTGSLSYLNAQESHSFSNTTSESIFDETLINTIIVDRDDNPLDTLFGVHRKETITKQSYLVTNIDLIGIGLGIGRSFDIHSNWVITYDIQLIPYILQRSKGLIIDPNGNLVDQSKLTIDGNQINLNNSVLGTQLNFALQYTLSSKMNIGLSSSYRYHIGNFSDLPILSIKRNYLGVGLKLGYML